MAGCLDSNDTDLSWNNATTTDVTVRVALGADEPGIVRFTASLEPFAPESECARAPRLVSGVTHVSDWADAVTRLDHGASDRWALYYTFDLPPRSTTIARVFTINAPPVSLMARADCDTTRQLTPAAEYDDGIAIDNPLDTTRHILILATGLVRAREGPVRVRAETGALVDRPATQGHPNPSDETQGHRYAVTWPASLCAVRPSADLLAPSNSYWEVKYGSSRTPFVWNLAPDGALWLSHPELEGRTVLRGAPPAGDDFLVRRTESGPPAVLTTSANMFARPRGLVATATGAYVIAHLNVDARLRGRALGLPPGEALLRFDARGALTWAEPLGTPGDLFTARAPDGTVRILLITTDARTLRGHAVGVADARRLVLLRARDGELDSVRDLGEGPPTIDDAIIDDDGGMRVRSGGTLLAFTGDGAFRWRATLSAGAHTLRRDGTAWTIGTNCPEALARSPLAVIICATVLESDGVSVVSETFHGESSSPDRYNVDHLALIAWGEALAFEYSGTRCENGTPPCLESRCEAIHSYIRLQPADLRGHARVGTTAPCAAFEGDATIAPWIGGVRCLRDCARDDTCREALPINTPSSCGAPGRSCVEAAALAHTLGRCIHHACSWGACLEGWADCNGDVDDGCEVELADSDEHCGACGRTCTGTCVGGRCCIGTDCRGPYDSDGNEGDFTPRADVALPAGVHHFGRIEIPEGVTVHVGQGGTLDLRAAGPVVIQGAIDLTGGDGTSGGRGGATGRRAAGEVDGGEGEGASCVVEARGAAPGQSSRSIQTSACVIYQEGASCSGLPRGGFAGDAAYDGAGPSTTMSSCLLGLHCGYGGYRCDWNTAGAGSIGPAALQDMAVTTTFRPGSGGGCTSCPDQHGMGLCGTSLGGGGGGGALRIASAVSITLGPAATLRADGGSSWYWSQIQKRWWVIGGNGAGSGGVVYLSAPSLDVARGALVSAMGFTGGMGRIRVSVDPARCHVAGTFMPPITPDCHPTPPDVRCATYVGRWPL